MTANPEAESKAEPHVIGGARKSRMRLPAVRDRNFRRPPPPSRMQQGELSALSARCGQWIQTFFSNRMRRVIPVEPEPVEALPYEVAVAGLAESAWVVPLKGPGANRAVLVLDREAQEWLILTSLGGNAGPAPAAAAAPDAEPPAADAAQDADAQAVTAATTPMASIGPISRRALRPVVDGLLREQGFVNLAGAEAGFVVDEERERAPRARLLRAADSVTSFNYAIHDGAKTFHIGFLFMHSTVAPHLSAPERESRTDPDPSLKKRLETTVRGLSTEVAVVLGGARIDLSEFLRLERGDVLVLDRRVGEALEISMGGRALFLGHPGRSQGKLAVRVSGRVEDKESR